MKKLIVLLGSNAVGKTTTAERLLSILPKSAYVDSDWCRAINPFPFTEATKKVYTNNMFDMLKNYLQCEDVENIICTYSFHGERKQIFEKILQRLRENKIEFEFCPIVLKCSREENIKRALNDGRDKERVERGILNTFSIYDDYEYPVIDTTNLSVDEVAVKVLELI